MQPYQLEHPHGTACALQPGTVRIYRETAVSDRYELLAKSR